MGAALMFATIPDAKTLLGDKGYDADWFRHALLERGLAPYIPPKSNRKMQIACDKTLYTSRHTKRKHVLQAQRLARYSHPTRPLHPRLHVRNRNCCDANLLEQSMRPELR